MIRQMKRAVGAALLAATPAIATPTCMQPAEMAADQVRYVQVQLNVAALLCRGTQNAEFPALYNAYVTFNQRYLVEGVPHIQHLAARKNVTIDTYLTKAFNRVSFESIYTQDFCARTLAAAKQAHLSPDPLDILPLLPVAYVAPERTCTGTIMVQGGPPTGAAVGRTED
ncbi:MAG: hypothetical protein EP335_10575 [Alphaproteobacteria bacterium]|nr:MAG: hypothetical protein EP335_10575 [Alphaproteobacteria bacterium]